MLSWRVECILFAQPFQVPLGEIASGVMGGVRHLQAACCWWMGWLLLQELRLEAGQ